MSKNIREEVIESVLGETDVPLECRQGLLISLLAPLECSEIQLILGISKQAVGQYLRRALRKLAKNPKARRLYKEMLGDSAGFPSSAIPLIGLLQDREQEVA